MSYGSLSSGKNLNLRLGRIDKIIPNQEQEYKVATNYDGVTPDKYITYLQLDTDTGAKIPLSDSTSLSKSLDYTIMMWLKPTSDNWNIPLSYIFNNPGGFACYLQQYQIIFESSYETEKLIANTSNIFQNDWFHLTISGKKLIGSYLLIEDHINVLNHDQKSYINLMQSHSGWSLCLGSCDNSFGFNGGIRDFVFIEEFLSANTANRLKNHYLTWDQSILAYYRFDQKLFSFDQFRFTEIQFYGFNLRDKMMNFDYTINDICYPFHEYEDAMYFYEDGIIQDSNINNRWNASLSRYQYSMSVWIQTAPDNCYTKNPLYAIENCTILTFKDIFTLYFETPTSAKFFFESKHQYNELQSHSIFIPMKQWINIQLTFSKIHGYDIKTYDLQGRLMDAYSYPHSLAQQMPIQKNFTLFKHFRGYVRNFILYAKSVTIPINYDMDDQYNDEECLFFIKFQQQYNDDLTLKNYCGGTNTQNINLNQAAEYKQIYWKNFSSEKEKSLGLISDPQKLFDGIACNDQDIFTQISNDNSFYHSTIQKDGKVVKQNMTVEFWFRPDKFQNINTLFQIYQNSSRSNYMEIAMSTQLFLNCAPFGISNQSSPYIQYSIFNEALIANYSWFHISCSYSYQDNVFGTLEYDDNIQTYQQDLSNISNYIPGSQNLDIYLGNSQKKNSGSILTKFKDLRVWNIIRSVEEIKSWKYRQLNPFSYTTDQLLLYLRLSEGGYEFINFQSIIENEIPQDIWVNDINLVEDTDLTICPQQTYYINGTCYFNPITKMIATIYPVYENEELYWVFSLNNSGILDSYIWQELNGNWYSNNQIFDYMKINQSSEANLVIPSYSFADQQILYLQTLLTNNASAFQEIYNFNFIPISCRYVIATDSQDSYSSYTQIDIPQSIKDFDFTFEVKFVNDDCDTYYDTLLPNITYEISPMLRRIPQINVQKLSDDILQLTIPKEEQSKFPLFTNVTIKFSIYFGSSKFQDIELFDTLKQYTFQNILYTINFAFDSMTVIPIINQNTDYGLIDETIVFNASETFITNIDEENKYDNLTFTWICPTNLTDLCADYINSPILEITYQQFLDSEAVFAIPYIFNMEISWQTQIGDVLKYYDTVEMTWFNYSRPNILLNTQSEQILASKENLFIIDHDDDLHLSDYQIQWSIVPNISFDLDLFLSYNQTHLTIPPLVFEFQTYYEVSCKVTSNQNALSSASKTIQFTTSTPPYGGSVRINPNRGYQNETEFQFVLRNWKSENPPILFRVWQTDGDEGTTPTKLLSDEWVSDDEPFQFLTSSSYPFVAEITDESLEVTYSNRIKVTLLEREDEIQESNSTNTTNNSIDNNATNSEAQNSTSQNSTENQAQEGSILNRFYTLLAQTRDDYSMKYNHIDNFAKEIEFNQNNIIDTQDQIDLIIQRLVNDQSMLQIQSFIKNGNAKIIMKKSIQILSQILKQPQFLDDEIIEKSSIILNSILQCQILEQEIQIDYQFTQDTLSVGENLRAYLRYINQNQPLRLLYEQNLYEEIEKIILQFEDKIIQNTCKKLQDKEQLQYSDEYLDMSFYKFSQDSYQYDVQLKSKTQNMNYYYIYLQEIIQQFSKQNEDFCIYAKFKKYNPLYEIKSELKYYDDATVNSLQLIIGQNEIKLDSISDFAYIYFQIDPKTFVNNQTQCTQYNQIYQTWEMESCETILNKELFQISCNCQRLSSQLISLFIDKNRIVGESLYREIQDNQVDQVFVQIEEVQENINYTQMDSYYLSIIVTLLLLSIIGPILSYILDKRDISFCQQMESKGHKYQILKNISQLSNQPLSFWIYKSDAIMSYQIQSTSLFTHLFFNIHPFISIFYKFDISESRCSRFFSYYLKLALYALICSVAFLYDQNSKKITFFYIILISCIFFYKNQYTIFKKKVKNIGSKQKLNQDFSGSIDRSNSKRRTYLYSENQDVSQQASINQQPSLQNQEQLTSIFYFNQKNILQLFTYILAYAFTALSIFFFLKFREANEQLNLIKAFYGGWIGNILILNLFMIIFNTIFVKEASKGNLNKFIMLFISNDAIKIFKEIELTKEADNMYSPSIDNFLVSMNQKDKVINEKQTRVNNKNDIDNIFLTEQQIQEQEKTIDQSEKKNLDENKLNYNSSATQFKQERSIDFDDGNSEQKIKEGQQNNNELIINENLHQEQIRKTVFERVLNSMQKEKNDEMIRYSSVSDNESQRRNKVSNQIKEEQKV